MSQEPLFGIDRPTLWYKKEVPLQPLESSFLGGVPLWAHLLLGACLLVAGTVLVLFVRRNRAPSFLHDFILVLGLTLPLLGGAILWELRLAPGSVWHDRVRLILILATCTLSLYALSRFLVTGLRWWAARSEPIRTSQRTLTRIVRLGVLVLGILVILEVLKVPITPLLTTLGIGSLAIALALQDTLTNLFSGLYIAADRPLREGDYIRLGTGEEGVVLGVGWRSTRLRNSGGNIVIVPNAKLSQATITNFDLEDRRVAISIRIPAAYGQDPRQILRALESAISGAAGQVAGLSESPKPSVQFDPGFSDLCMDFTINCQILGIEHEGRVKSELRQRAAEGLSREGLRLIRSGPPG